MPDGAEYRSATCSSRNTKADRREKDVQRFQRLSIRREDVRTVLDSFPIGRRAMGRPTRCGRCPGGLQTASRGVAGLVLKEASLSIRGKFHTHPGRLPLADSPAVYDSVFERCSQSCVSALQRTMADRISGCSNAARTERPLAPERIPKPERMQSRM